MSRESSKDRHHHLVGEFGQEDNSSDSAYSEDELDEISFNNRVMFKDMVINEIKGSDNEDSKSVEYG